MLRGVNVGAHNRMKMDALRDLCGSLDLRDAQTYIQSGNVIFRSKDRNVARLAKCLQDGIEKRFKIGSDVVVRSVAEMRAIVTRNPFAHRRDIDPAKLLVVFLAGEPSIAAIAEIAKIKTEPDDVRIVGHEMFIYYVSGLARPKVPWTTLMKKLKTTGTGRNWNGVVEMLAMAEKLNSSA